MTTRIETPFIHGLRLLALALLAILLAGCQTRAEPEALARPAMVVQPSPVSADFMVFPGEVRARHEPQLAFRVGGKIHRRLVEVGDRVVKDQVLAELDPDDLKLQAEAARAQHAAAQADFELARAERDRHRSLLERQLISQSLFEVRDNQFRAAQARAQQARAQLDVASNQAGYALLRASDDGLIAQRLAEAGQVVAAGQPVFVLAADGEREILISLPEQGIGQYSVGQRVTVGLWSRPDQRIGGEVRELAPAADAQARTYAARIRIDANDQGIELGQTARVLFAHNGKSALSLPLAALTADGGRHYVWVVDPAALTVQRRAVEIGPFGDNSATVLDGLGADEWVVSGGVHLLIDGQRVRPVDRDNRTVAMVAAG
jgi:membrane fusion protein, multidrug efflux system